MAAPGCPAHAGECQTWTGNVEKPLHHVGHSSRGHPQKGSFAVGNVRCGAVSLKQFDGFCQGAEAIDEI
jgi:hypothetical protein